MENWLALIGALFTNSWAVLCSINVPGLDLSFAGLLVAVFLIGISIRVIQFVTGGHLGSADPTRSLHHNFLSKGGKD